MATGDGVTITFEMRLKPEAVGPFLQNAPRMLEGAAGFPGFRNIRIVQSKDDPARILFVERWDSEEAYRGYIAWRTERGEIAGLAERLVSAETTVWPNLIVEA